MNAQLLSLRALFGAVGAIHLATAALSTLVALQIAEIGGTQEAASMVAAAYSLGFLIGCFRIARPLARIGYIRAFAAACALCILATLALARTDSTTAMFIARFITGLATAGLYAIADAWINDSAGSEVRGRILSIYAIVLGVTSVLSQGFILGHSGNLADGFIVISMIFCIAIVVLASTRTDPPDTGGGADIRLREVFRDSPTAFIGVFVSGFIVTIMLTVFPFRAAEIGLGTGLVALAIGAFYAGRIVFQYPLGKASDDTDRRVVIAWCAGVTAVILLIVAIMSDGEASRLRGANGGLQQFMSLLLAFLLGGALLPQYSILVAHGMDRTVPVYVPSAAVTLLLVFTIGAVVGPLAAAVVSAVLSDGAVVWSEFVIVSAYLLFTLHRLRRRDPVPRAEHAVHRAGAPTSVEMAPVSKR